jgi:serine/threonine protein kinase
MAGQVKKLRLEMPSFLQSIILPSFVKIGNPFDESEDVKEIDEGAFGSVYQMQSRDGQLKAVKVLEAGATHSERFTKALNEATISRQMQHPNIVKTHEVWYDGIRIFIVMELLTQLSKPFFPDSSLKSKIGMIQELVSALIHMHLQGFLHIDIKPQNIGVKTHGQLCLFDFGESFKKSEHHRKCVGTVLFMAPEVVKYCQYSESSEMWAFICFLIEFIIGESLILLLFESTAGLRQIDVQLKIDSLKEPPIPAVFKEDSSASGLLMLQILERGLAIEPKERLTFSELECLLQELITLL